MGPESNILKKLEKEGISNAKPELWRKLVNGNLTA